MSRKARWLVLAAPILVGAALRAAHVRAVRSDYLPLAEPVEGYYEQGVRLASHGLLVQGPADTRPAAWAGPLYPSFIAGLGLFQERPTPASVRIAAAVLSVLALLAVNVLGQRLVSPLAGWLAALWLALDADQILSTGSLNIHCFYGLCLLAAATALVLWLERQSPARGALLGLLLAASLLCRSAHLALPLLAGAAFLRRGRSGTALRRLVWPAAFMAAFWSPWPLRNAAHFGRFYPLDSNRGSVNFFAASLGGLESWSIDKAVRRAEELSPGLLAAVPPKHPQKLYPLLLELGLRSVRERPFRYLWTSLLRLRLLYGGLWPAILLGAYGLARRRTPALEAVGLAAASLASYGLIGVQESYRAGVLPLLALLAGCGCARLLEDLSRRGWVRRLPAVPPLTPSLARAGLSAFLAPFVLAYAATTGFLAAEVYHYGWQDPLMGRAACGERRETPDRGLIPPSVLDRCLELYPQDAGLWLDRGVARARQGDRAEAAHDLRTAAGLRPDFLEAWVSLASFLAEEGRGGEALPGLGRALRLAARRRGEPPYAAAQSLRRRLAASGPHVIH